MRKKCPKENHGAACSNDIKGRAVVFFRMAVEDFLTSGKTYVDRDSVSKAGAASLLVYVQ